MRRDSAQARPHGAAALHRRAGVRTSTAYVGDSPGDVLVSRNAGAFAIGVSWGYHHADALRKAGADVVIEDARELLQFAVER